MNERGMTPRAAVNADKEMLEAQLQQEEIKLAHAEEELEMAKQSLEPLEEEHHELADKFKQIVSDQQRVVAAHNKAHAKRVYESKALELEQLELEQQAEKNGEVSTDVEAQWILHTIEIEQYKQALELAEAAKKSAADEILALQKDKDSLQEEYLEALKSRQEVQAQENTVSGKYTEVQQLQMRVVDNKLRLQVLKEDKDAKKALVMELEEKRRSKDDDLQGLQDTIKDFTDLTNQEVGDHITAIDDANQQIDEFRAEMKEIKLRMGGLVDEDGNSRLPPSPDRPVEHHSAHHGEKKNFVELNKRQFDAQSEAAKFGY